MSGKEYERHGLCLTLLEKCRDSTKDDKASGTFKRWEMMESAQGPRVRMNGRELIMLGSNNYLNLVSRPEVLEAAIEAIKRYGCGMASGRDLCGTNELHEQLEAKLSRLSGTDSALLYHSCYSANIGVLSALAGQSDIIFSDELNHASIIDGCRMSKAEVKVYPHLNVDTLDYMLGQERRRIGLKIVVTDGVFSFDGDIAPLQDIIKVARNHSAVVVVDEAHAAGVIGPSGGGTADYFGVAGQVDVITGTLGKALGGTVGGYAASHSDVIDFLIKRSRSFIFTNALPPAVVAANIVAIDLLQKESSILTRLHKNARRFRQSLTQAGFKVLGSGTPIVPVLIGDTEKTVKMSRRLFSEGVFAPGFGYPVTPHGKARIRTITCADHTQEDLDYAAAAFARIGAELQII